MNASELAKILGKLSEEDRSKLISLLTPSVEAPSPERKAKVQLPTGPKMYEKSVWEKVGKICLPKGFNKKEWVRCMLDEIDEHTNRIGKCEEGLKGCEADLAACEKKVSP